MVVSSAMVFDASGLLSPIHTSQERVGFRAHGQSKRTYGVVVTHGARERSSRSVVNWLIEWSEALARPYGGRSLLSVDVSLGSVVHLDADESSERSTHLTVVLKQLGIYTCESPQCLGSNPDEIVAVSLDRT